MENSGSPHAKSISSPRSRSSSPTRPSAWSQTYQVINDIVADAPLGKIFNKSLIGFYFVFALWLIWRLLALSDNWTQSKRTPSQGEATLHNYFSNFEGYSECGIRAAELYSPPPQDERGFYEYGTFCHDRKHLLEALSEGGRIGFDTPYKARGCNYRWFRPIEICNILTRFDSLVFIGDDSLLPIYAGLNILLRQDLALGALDPTSTSPALQSECRCNNQYIKEDCRAHFLTDSEKLIHADDKTHGTPYICNRPNHAYLRFTPPTLDTQTLTKFAQLVPRAPKSAYRPIPIITSLSPSTFTPVDASTFLISTLRLADDTDRNTPMLWIGPTAAGHIEIKGRKGNQEIWDFDQRMARTAVENDIDVLGMWNMTVQAGSWDGVRFGERVAIVQAMMVVNWLSRLESS